MTTLPVLLLILGAVFALLFVVIAVIQVRRGNPAVNPVAGLLMVAAAGLFISYSIQGTEVYRPPLGAGVVLLIVAAALFSLERANGQGQSTYSLVSATAALMIITGAVLAPTIDGLVTNVIGNTLAPQNLSDEVAQARASASNRVNPVALTAGDPPPTPVLVAELPAQPTATPIEPTPTATPFTYEMPTPVPAICNGTVTANLNMREEPALDANRIDIIPEGTFINVFERDNSGEWLRVTFNQRRGWVSASIVNLEDACGL